MMVTHPSIFQLQLQVQETPNQLKENLPKLKNLASIRNNFTKYQNLVMECTSLERGQYMQESERVNKWWKTIEKTNKN